MMEEGRQTCTKSGQALQLEKTVLSRRKVSGGLDTVRVQGRHQGSSGLGVNCK